ncbi:hypothetical protein Z949_481 [Sulfitobacter guttiformis KCTC 32187]|nr:hypothetical protein Z949_481 [Sulfitobacter guttiformis KCTC 32187]
MNTLSSPRLLVQYMIIFNSLHSRRIHRISKGQAMTII